MINIPGQMNQNTQRGKLLMQNIKENSYNTIVEIGTWNGLGSTLCVLNTMKENCEFFSLESNKKFYDIASNNLEQHKEKLKLTYGSLITHDELKDFSLSLVLNAEQKLWLEEDLSNLKNTKIVLEELPETIDLLVLDGGEFSSFLEWEKLKLRTKVVALDDCNVLKNSKVVNELEKDKNYVKVYSTDEGHGFVIFKKIN